jgi:hypothetical protein
LVLPQEQYYKTKNTAIVIGERYLKKNYTVTVIGFTVPYLQELSIIHVTIKFTKKLQNFFIVI